MNYINLTSGLEFLEEIPDAKFIRIQSTLCEQKQWSRIIEDLDYDFLINLAQGQVIFVFDTSSNKKCSRALYQGMEFIRYVLERRWFNTGNEQAYVKGHNVTQYFAQEYEKLSERAKKKVDYVKKFLNTNKIYLKGICKHSQYDGNYEYYKKLINQIGGK